MSNIDFKKKYFEHILSQENILPSLKYIENHILNLFRKKYFFSKNYYEKIIINSIIYNQKVHIVSKFKEYLVIDDLSEFLKRFYTKNESTIRLPLYFGYYQAYSKIFPNYTAIKESKYIYKNIHRKQKMIDMQQEEELEMLKKEEVKHQRKKNKQEINTIFNNDIYNSIIKQSQDLYMILFGIDKNKNKKEVGNSFSSFDIKDIVNEIDKYDYESKIRFNYKNNLIIPMYKNINSKKYILKDNNSSLLTKQSTFNSSNLYQKIKNFKNNDDVIVGLKKIKNDKKYINSNSLLISQKIKKNVRGHLKSLTFGKFFFNLKEKSKSKSKSKKKDNKKQNIIRVNQKLLIDDNNNNLTDRSLMNKKCNNLKKIFLYNCNTANNSKIKSKIINKKLNKFNYKKINSIKINNSNIYRHIRINTNDNINNITELSNKNRSYKAKVINKTNRTSGKNSFEKNNKLKINLTKIRELIKNKKLIDKFCYTERSSITPKQRYKNEQKTEKNQNLEKIYRKINNHKKSVPSIDIKTKINKKIILSHKIISFKKINKCNYKTNFLPLPFKESFKLNKNQIKQICDKKTNSNNDKTEDRKYYTERGSIQCESNKYSQEKKKQNIFNDIPFIKKIEFKYYNTATNSKKKDKIKNNIENTNNNKNSYLLLKINKTYKRKKREISPINYYNNLNNTERNKNYFNIKKLLNRIKK